MQGTYLEVPHRGDQCVCFKAAMEERNKRMVLQGQPEAVRHVCNKCMRVFEMDGGKFCMYILSSWLQNFNNVPQKNARQLLLMESVWAVHVVEYFNAQSHS